MTDLVAASLSTFLMFGLGYAFAHQIQSGIREVQQWVTVIVALGVAIWLLVRYDRARRRSGLPVGPPVLDSDDVPVAVERSSRPLISPERRCRRLSGDSRQPVPPASEPIERACRARGHGRPGADRAPARGRRRPSHRGARMTRS